MKDKGDLFDNEMSAVHIVGYTHYSMTQHRPSRNLTFTAVKSDLGSLSYIIHVFVNVLETHVCDLNGIPTITYRCYLKTVIVP